MNDCLTYILLFFYFLLSSYWGCKSRIFDLVGLNLLWRPSRPTPFLYNLYVRPAIHTSQIVYTVSVQLSLSLLSWPTSMNGSLIVVLTITFGTLSYYSCPLFTLCENLPLCLFCPFVFVFSFWKQLGIKERSGTFDLLI